MRKQNKQMWQKSRYQVQDFPKGLHQGSLLKAQQSTGENQAWWRTYASVNWVIIGSVNDTKPLPEPMLN